ncbi:MAG: nucleotidyltransferase family protein [Caulobacterales bacterium]|uniref:nucleotidyltransferase family protein n=1 Tax=Glycocaulis sp. TaxID=1969725 RepID=UPI003F9EBB7A
MRPHRAMVMAAGLGTRMRPLTDDRPKALVEVGGRALLDWTLDALARGGVEEAVVNIHHFADRMRAHLENRQGAPLIHVSDETERLLETGGGLVKAAPLLGADPVFVANIDAFWIDEGGVELNRLAGGFDPEAMDFRLLLARKNNLLGLEGAGDFAFAEGGRLIRFKDAPAGAEPLFYAGVQVMHPRVLAGWPCEPFSTNRLWDVALKAGRVTGQVMDAFWMHVGDPQSRDAAENRLVSGA